MYHLDKLSVYKVNEPALSHLRLPGKDEVRRTVQAVQSETLNAFDTPNRLDKKDPLVFWDPQS